MSVHDENISVWIDLEDGEVQRVNLVCPLSYTPTEVFDALPSGALRARKYTPDGENVEVWAPGTWKRFILKRNQ